ncbi:MAG: hypothetical protein AAB401_17925, partial [Acidobacteriota bacterium]
ATVNFLGQDRKILSNAVNVKIHNLIALASDQNHPANARIGNDFVVFKIQLDFPFLHRGCTDDGLLRQAWKNEEFVRQTQVVQIKIQPYCVIYSGIAAFVGRLEFKWFRQCLHIAEFGSEIGMDKRISRATIKKRVQISFAF